jgi:cysteinylglycine-S-conjugate dipeptidase
MGRVCQNPQVVPRDRRAAPPGERGTTALTILGDMAVDSEVVASLSSTVAALMPAVRADLERLVAIPSVNFPNYPTDPVVACAEAVAELVRSAGATDVQLVAGSAAVPTVVAEVPGPAGSPTVVMYSHYDVQPGGDTAKWNSPPFTPTLRDGRLYGRGAADDKSGIVSHIATLRAFGGKPPVTLRMLLEGEEEFGGDFEEWPTTRPEAFEGVSAAIINDMGPVELGIPTFTTALRGVVAGVVTVGTLEEARHNGQFGGPAPDALMVLIKLLATLMDDHGDATVDGISGTAWSGAEFPPDDFRVVAGVLPGVPLIGSHDVASHLFSLPSVNVVGLDAPPVDTAPNAIIPMARAKISVRIPAGVDGREAMQALSRHVESHAPWGVTVHFEPEMAANGTLVPTAGPAHAAYRRAMAVAYGREPVEQGAGGAIPFVATLLEEFPDIEVMGIGAQDPPARIHAPNESIDLAELQRSILAEVLFLAELASV